VKIAVKHDDFLFSVLDFLFLESIIPHGLDGGFNGFHAAVLGKDLIAVSAEPGRHLGGEFGGFRQKNPQGIREDHIGQNRGIVSDQGIHDSINNGRMVMAGICRRISGKAVQIFPAFFIFSGLAPKT